MIAKDLYIVNKGINDFRPYEPALVIGYKLVKPSENLDYRYCYEVRYSDGVVDYIFDSGFSENKNNFYTLEDIANAMHLKGKDEVKEIVKTPFNIPERYIDSTKKYYFKCLIDNCTLCNGTGYKVDGSICIHTTSCICQKCNPLLSMFKGATKW